MKYLIPPLTQSPCCSCCHAGHLSLSLFTDQSPLLTALLMQLTPDKETREREWERKTEEEEAASHNQNFDYLIHNKAYSCQEPWRLQCMLIANTLLVCALKRHQLVTDATTDYYFFFFWLLFCENQGKNKHKPFLHDVWQHCQTQSTPHCYLCEYEWQGFMDIALFRKNK